MAMLLNDYGNILTDALCNSHQDFYTDYLAREFKKLNKEGYSNREIKHNTTQVIEIIRTRIRQLYKNNLATYRKYKEANKGLAKENQYNYPKPNINNIPILRIHFPSGITLNLQGLSKRFYLKDITKIEKSINELLDTPPDTKVIMDLKFPVKSYSLLHVYWSKYDNTKRITDTNKLKLSETYNFSQNTLKRYFDLYSSLDERKPTSNNIRAVGPFIKALEGAISMLKTCCPKGFQDAERELKSIKNHYLPN